MNLIILEKSDLVCGAVYRVGGARGRHITGVLGGEVGDEIEVGLLDGPVGVAKICEIDGNEVSLECSWDSIQPVRKPEIYLVCALCRPQTLKKVLQSAAVMGVERVFLVNAKRVEQCYFNASVMGKDSIKRQLLAGLGQGRRTRLPGVEVHGRFGCFFEETLPRMEAAVGKCVKLVADVDAKSYFRPGIFAGAERVIAAIGPEGGWVDHELGVLEGVGFERFRLSNSILRVENAVVAAIAQIELASDL